MQEGGPNILDIIFTESKARQRLDAAVDGIWGDHTSSQHAKDAIAALQNYAKTLDALDKISRPNETVTRRERLQAAWSTLTSLLATSETLDPDHRLRDQLKNISPMAATRGIKKRCY